MFPSVPHIVNYIVVANIEELYLKLSVITDNLSREML